MKKAKPANSVENLYQSAYWHLARRDMSEHEILGKLRAKTENQEWIDEVLEHLRQENYLNDERFVESFIRMSCNINRHGPVKIRSNLRMLKGIHDEALINMKFDETECDFFELAKELKVKKFGTEDLDFKESGKAYRYLASRGFTREQIVYALEKKSKLD